MAGRLRHQARTTVAYVEAVKAIEAALIPLATPNDQQATLGKALGTLRSTTAKWELAIPDDQGTPADIHPLLDLAGLVWHGHRDRHAGTPTANPASATAAEMALHTAVMIVYWTNCGGLRRR